MKKEDSIIKLSIITPYYKTLEFTKQLAKVLEPQLTKECEWIIIDDGCNELELDKLKAKVIHQKINYGVSNARNTGLDIAQGQYITFIDSDDIIKPNYIEKILNKINEEQFDYCFFSWEGTGRNTGKYIIKDKPKQFNTSVWNCIYSKKAIGDTRFPNSEQIGEEIEFNKKVRTGKKANILDILYIYQSGRQDSLTVNYSQGKIKKERDDVNSQIVLYRSFLSKIGGIETAIYNFCLAFKDEHEIIFMYDNTDVEQIIRLKKLVKCIQYKGQKINCDCFIYYGVNPQTIERTLNANKIIQQICNDMLSYNTSFIPTTSNIYADSISSSKSFTKKYNIECGVLHNLFNIEPKRCLNLMSATRLAWEKGYDRMKQMAKRLNELNIPFTWEVFTNDKPNEEIDGLIFRKPRLNATDYMSNKDYIIQLSNFESWGCTITEGLECGVPVITTDFASAYEQIEDGINGYILKRDMSNLDDVINRMYNNNLKGFKYTKQYSNKEWEEVLQLPKKKSNYVKEKNDEIYRVISLKNIFFTDENVQANIGTEFTVNSKERLNYLIANNAIKLK